MRCKACRYSLKSLTEHRCPECGRELDPSDSTTVVTESALEEKREIWLGLGVWIVLMLALLAIAFGSLFWS
jgi:predicted amidophosphoribosyltransferase